MLPKITVISVTEACACKDAKRLKMLGLENLPEG